jgi:hypothetical protein
MNQEFASSKVVTQCGTFASSEVVTQCGTFFIVIIFLFSFCRVEAIIDLLYQPRMCLAEETEVLGGNLPQCRFVHHKFHMTYAGSNPGLRGGKPATCSLSYGTAYYIPWWVVQTVVLKNAFIELGSGFW